MDFDIKRILQSVKVDDEHIVLNKPLVIDMYGREIIIKQIKWLDQWDNFVLYLGLFLDCLSVQCGLTELPADLNELKNFRFILKTAIGTIARRKLIMGYLKNLCGFAENCDEKFMKQFSIDDYIILFLYLYLYNVMGVKKNLKIAFQILRTVA